ncbi:MAG: hypothetical protein ACEPO2_14930 [Pelagibaca sp.]
MTADPRHLVALRPQGKALVLLSVRAFRSTGADFWTKALSDRAAPKVRRGLFVPDHARFGAAG